MSETKFTPGPWEAVLLNDWSDATYIEGALFASQRALPGKFDQKEQDKIHANAHLIAAAPDLYEALHQLVGNISDAVLEPPKFLSAAAIVFWNESVGEILRARAALAKARGE